MPVGLDLGSHTFRAVELIEIKGNVSLTKFGSYENPRISLESQSAEDLLHYTAAIKDFFAEVGFSGTDVFTSIPEAEVFTRVVKMPQMSEKELRSSILFEIEQYIPLPSKDINYDLQIIDNDAIDRDKMNVLIVAAKKEVANKYVGLIKGAGLSPKGLEPETLSISRALGGDGVGSNAALIVNFGSNASQIIVNYRGFVRFTRSMSIGGNALTRAVIQSLNLEYNQAEEYKRTYGLDNNQAEGKVFNAIKPVFDNVLSEIRRAKVFYTTHNPNVIINRIILCGGTALMPGLLFYVANNLDLEVELANPWRNIVFSDRMQSQKEQLIEMGPVFVSAVGLALKELRKNVV
ncbi:type IV pilus assembly protein PilM [candidate division WWE3 bacterium]|nr:type IV pilus assembly protein PilM [candidate division WWE3 bacterium]